MNDPVDQTEVMGGEEAKKKETLQDMVASIRDRLMRIENSIMDNHVRLNNLDTWIFQDEMQKETIGCSKVPYNPKKAKKIVSLN